jgi:hypothetical protein
MSQTWKDSARQSMHRTTLEVTRSMDVIVNPENEIGTPVETLATLFCHFQQLTRSVRFWNAPERE